MVVWANAMSRSAIILDQVTGAQLNQIPKLGNRPYSRSEVIHRAGDESLFPAFERERPRIVNNFAASASSGYEFSSISEKMNSTRLSNLAVVLGSGNEYSDEDESSLETITSGYKEFASGSGRANDRYPPSPEYERICLRATA